jgi:hypothetical protein
MGISEEAKNRFEFQGGSGIGFELWVGEGI